MDRVDHVLARAAGFIDKAADYLEGEKSKHRDHDDVVALRMALAEVRNCRDRLREFAG